MEAKKCVFVGDHSADKTRLLISYMSQLFPSESIPTILENYPIVVMIDESLSVTLRLWETTFKDDFESLLPLIYMYPQTDVIVICFSLVNPSSFKNVRFKWYPEVRVYCPLTPIVLVGTKKDLRDCSQIVTELKEKRLKPISCRKGRSLSKKIKAVKYIECSFSDQMSLNNVFDEAIRAASLEPSVKLSKCTCVLL